LNSALNKVNTAVSSIAALARRLFQRTAIGTQKDEDLKKTKKEEERG
jgi:hypothetical protein